MIKQQADARREVTANDIEATEKAISANAEYTRSLYTILRILGEVGNLDQAVRGGREAVALVQREGQQVNAHLEAAKAELANTQNRNVELKKENATLAATAEEQRRMISAYAEQIDRITGAKAA